MNHPLPIGTKVLVVYDACASCGGIDEKVITRIREVDQDDDVYLYTMLDGRVVTQDRILEVK